MNRLRIIIFWGIFGMLGATAAMLYAQSLRPSTLPPMIVVSPVEDVPVTNLTCVVNNMAIDMEFDFKWGAFDGEWHPVLIAPGETLRFTHLHSENSPILQLKPKKKKRYYLLTQTPRGSSVDVPDVDECDVIGRYRFEFWDGGVHLVNLKHQVDETGQETPR